MNQILQYFGKNSKKGYLSRQVIMIPRNHKKVAQEVTLRKPMFEGSAESANCQKVILNCFKN